MKVLIGCEFSGVVRDAFRSLGHEAYSCDLVASPDNSLFHFQDDVFKVVASDSWDIGIFHPPCTYLTVAGARWWKDRAQEQVEALEFVERLWQLPIPKVAIENPIGAISTMSGLGKATQIIQPWMFGHGETKATCLWLRGLPTLEPTNIVEGRFGRVHWESPGIKNGLTRAQRRSITYTGIAEAMAEQWGTC